ncbi:uncharacterized protein LOC120276312 [Dioscorea cayenensis subsp. rotundata]|uniref:Uncharacterized protein LOC120276312 n=1 Tax=Dioscorea cayennensis subsp. rotundata TaxID=55577 RepID=A0AB40CGA4_DIOCR|nr:uncharacterized protein LOC120276312 [Dioscorea cayenensis subsp. rotundata]
MASSLLLLLILFMSTSLCLSNPDAVGIVAKALACFNDHYVYNHCEEAYRLSAEGTIPVPPEGTDVYCSGPCLAETKLVLSCLHDIFYNFQFYNGASIQDVRYTLDAGCGYSDRRGDFNVGEHLEGDPYGFYYDHGNKKAIPNYMLLFYSFFLAIWGYYYF